MLIEPINFVLACLASIPEDVVASDREPAQVNLRRLSVLPEFLSRILDDLVEELVFAHIHES